MRPAAEFSHRAEMPPDRLQPLLAEVRAEVEGAGLPLDSLHLAVILETAGWTDASAQRQGYESRFALARDLYPYLAASLRYAVARPGLPRPGWRRRALGAWHFLLGLVLGLPMLLPGPAGLAWPLHGDQALAMGGIVLMLALSAWLHHPRHESQADGLVAGDPAGKWPARWADFAGTQPRRWLMRLSQLQPFFRYGVCFFLYLHGGRLLAGIGSDRLPVVAQPPWLAGFYPPGLTWAGLFALFPLGLAEAGLQAIAGTLHRESAVMAAAAIPALNRRLQRALLRWQLAVGLAAVPSLAAVRILTRWMHPAGGADVLPLIWPESGLGLIVGGGGLALLAGGVLSTGLLFTIGQPGSAVRAMAVATCFSLFTASVTQAEVGSLAGALMLWWLGSRAAHRALAQADYLLFRIT